MSEASDDDDSNDEPDMTKQSPLAMKKDETTKLVQTGEVIKGKRITALRGHHFVRLHC